MDTPKVQINDRVEFPIDSDHSTLYGTIVGVEGDMVEVEPDHEFFWIDGGLLKPIREEE